ncbi:glucosamine-6-phosphate deaminase [Staphylococcus carnosus]|uniref:Glucosamine-6-phosphate deaminase n=1 Tax=Staphylococcus carnosus (strain TM300) TaxID=396513 RepID=B9DIJ6_STACT|nr:glucosamine-6-phosphate deaminase [Staphylococcus carnosus]KOR12608.1 glucosamine-6-phosphate deaminase [Staphylococcus carnosus]QPT03049.1 glucosamine-6-phosphate deaminase [Staphylococcus carnosus]UQA68052.1 glucosamine-6-phosphate deaminase [Staphylococcus carnosus]UTB77127.1 glucosamine-6-phosphate deaminase [Staphylococcus carnosus]UTB86675.1 glucosamine-6-phosphate deaminase [Staphylococcus carnosus]
MEIYNLKDKSTASIYTAIEMLKTIKTKPDAIFGLATGSTMVDLYPQLSNLLNVNKVDVSQVRTFNLDEYVGLNAEHTQSYHTYMHERLFQQYEGWNQNNIHIPNGIADDMEHEGEHYEKLLQDIGKPDIQILGIGENGHIGFNEPGTPFDSVTRIVDLTPSTLHANSVHFETEDEVPKQAISMGLSSIMRAKRIILLAFGEKKIDAIQRLAAGNVSEDLPASILHNHPNVEIIVDETIYKAL